jgi:hypothetical protein
VKKPRLLLAMYVKPISIDVQLKNGKTNVYERSFG